MIAPIPFWMDDNSSINFGLANHLQIVSFLACFKKSPFVYLYFSNPLQTYQTYSRAYNLSFSPFCIFGGLNNLV
jgi:hypothetical protein